MCEFVKTQDIFDDVCDFYGWFERSCTVDIESKRKLLRNKYEFLTDKVIFRNRKQFKEKGKNMVPVIDAPIIRELLKRAIATQDNVTSMMGEEWIEAADGIIVKWFNGNLDTRDSLTSAMLYNEVYSILLRLALSGEIDDVTLHEWADTISASINYNTAVNTIHIKDEIEDFRAHALALNQNIGIGDIIYEDNADRHYILEGKEISFDVENEPIGKLLKNVASQDDYLNIISQVLHLLEKDARKKAIQKIKVLLKYKAITGDKKADDWLNKKTLASEYVVWYQRIYEFLLDNPEVLSEIIEETKEEDVLDYFKMQDRGSKNGGKKQKKF